MTTKNLLLALLLILPLKSLAGGYTTIGLMYMNENRGFEGTTQQQSRTLIDFGAGKMWGNGFCFGIKYGSEKNEYATSSEDRTGIGPTIGWMKSKSQGLYIMGTYFINPTMTGGLKGKGSQIDLGFRFQLDKVSIGPQLSQKSFTYNEANGTTLDPAYQDNRIDPYFTVWIDF